MKRIVDISASVICVDWFRMEAQLRLLWDSGVRRLHIDIMDGKAASDFGIPIPLLRQIPATFDFLFDYHVMCEDSERVYGRLPVESGDTACFHLNQARSPMRDLVRLTRQGFAAGFAVSSQTPAHAYEPMLRHVQLITVVAVPPGAIGATGDPHAAARIAELRHIRQTEGLGFKIVADGNVTPARATDLVAAGADILVGGSTGLFRKNMSLSAALTSLRAAVQSALPAEGRPGDLSHLNLSRAA